MSILNTDQLQQFRIDSQKGTSERSVRWYQDKIRSLGLTNVQPKNALQSELGTLQSRLTIGNLYLFFYDPKLKETLPYYDRFPLVLPFRYNPDGFHGINLHYLPPLLRMKLLQSLLTIGRAGGNSPNRLKVSWNVLNNFSRFPEIGPCVKQYLFSHVQTRFLKINADDWKTVVMLPLEQFEKATKNSVYQESVRKIHA